jgi:hypothetical protein
MPVLPATAAVQTVANAAASAGLLPPDRARLSGTAPRSSPTASAGGTVGRRHGISPAPAVLCGPQCVAADGEGLRGGDGLGDGGIDGVGALAVLAVDEEHGVAVCGRLDGVG